MMKSVELTFLLNRSLEKASPIACSHVRAIENDGEPLGTSPRWPPTFWSQTEATHFGFSGFERLDVWSEDNISSEFN